ncbi:spore gernimation protein [Bacillus lacus]|uniref:Spore gernimation protein n=1 Tax=Metabacillus lacus TaxID=1983721 RepID=A0A7X2LZX6_9BACI|nr:GDSL-type esterase/lipase family protein [Metabacillus lacus]MRX73911.1 spore gernimation protein [Metabacillus lacus]
MNKWHEKDLDYIALGDSLTVGTGVPFWQQGFAERYLVESRRVLCRPVRFYKFAKNGATAGEILEISKSPCVEKAIREADIITITAGGNDLIRAARLFLQTKEIGILNKALKECTVNISALLTHIDALIAECEGPYIIRMINLYNPFSGTPQADSGVQKFNQHINSFSSYKNVKVADIYSVFKGREKELLSEDGIHPNARGYSLMEKTVSALGYSPLA